MGPELSVQEVDEILETGKREIAYERCLHESNTTIEVEKARRLRLNTLLAEDKNEDLYSQLAQDEDHINDIESQRDDLLTQLETSSLVLESVQGDLRRRNREVEMLKAELFSLQSISAESSKVLTEKLSLSRELFSLRPEVEHLRAQAASSQGLLSEKLSLQRQISAIQVELETEKRAAQRAAAKEGSRNVEDAKLESQLQSVQMELGKERKERQRIERDLQKVSAEFEAKKTILESRLDAFRNKLRITKEQLKDSQAEARTRASSLALAPTHRSSEVVETASRNTKKRSFAQVEADTMIGTPGPQPAAKRGKRGSTAPGEKSTFSITPFLNRTGSLAPQSPEGSPSDGKRNVEALNEREPDIDASDISPSIKSTTSVLVKEKSSHATFVPKAGKASTTSSRKTGSLKLGAGPRLEQVVEGDEGQDNETGVSKETVDAQQPPRETNERAIVKKKRKLLGGGPGKTLFDEDDGDIPRIDRGRIGGVKLVGAPGPSRLGAGPPKFGSLVKGGAAGGFGAFSPLKKDRRPATALGA